MPLVKKLTRIGNSTGLILPQPVLDQVGLEANAEVELVVKGNSLTIRPLRHATDEEFSRAHLKVASRRKKLFQRLSK
ncbi:MAG TPA: AbrB/MazE/SpoVT family DNA-binding domain-containing protein [Acidobacteriota bacterium]|jgi:antitoxin component of MazEF toxin-antitoxin module